MSDSLPTLTPIPSRVRDFLTSLQAICDQQSAHHPHSDVARFAASVSDLCAAFLETA